LHLRTRYPKGKTAFQINRQKVLSIDLKILHGKAAGRLEKGETENREKTSRETSKGKALLSVGENFVFAAKRIQRIKASFFRC